jgi:hypothetical protein
MNNLPTAHPAEVLEISPEGLEIANAFLQCQDIGKTAEDLGISRELVASYLERREVKAYVDSVFFNLGFNNRFKMRGLMDTIIQKKLQEMDEAEIGSNKDISELLALSHKMTMELMDKEIQLEKIRSANVKTQTNIQINDAGGGSRYGSLIEQLLNPNTL